MKAIFIGAAAALTVRESGIDKEEIMQNQISHFRKVWPEGIIDNSHGDDEVLDMFAEPLPRKKQKPAPPVITYPWSFDEDVIKTDKSLQQAETITNRKLSLEGVKNGGMDMINFYDNERRVFERDTPYGNTWWKPHTKIPE